MKATLLLAWRYIAYHRARTVIVVSCVALTFFLPLAVWLLVDHFEEAMFRRATSVPMVIGPKGDKFELLLRSVYFRGTSEQAITVAELEELEAKRRGMAIPLLLGRTAQGVPIVATTVEYFEKMGLRARDGNLPLRLGDAVLGANVPGRLRRFDGHHLNSDVNPHRPTELSLRMRVTGVLAPTDSPDDNVVFVELKTGWVLLGLGHGHVEPGGDVDPATVLQQKEGEVVFNPAQFKAQEITPQNIRSFHFHGDPEAFPVSAVLVWPEDRKARDILVGYYQPRVHATAQAIEPRSALEEFLGLLFKIKAFFDANVVTVAISTGLFLALVVLLSLKIREREMETLRKIGCSRWKVFWVQATELSLLVVAGLLLAGALSAGAYWFMVESRMLL